MKSSFFLSTLVVCMIYLSSCADDDTVTYQELVMADVTGRTATTSDSVGTEPVATPTFSAATVANDGTIYVLNTSSKKIHTADCRYAKDMLPENYSETTDIAAAIAEGYSICQVCHPQ